MRRSVGGDRALSSRARPWTSRSTATARPGRSRSSSKSARSAADGARRYLRAPSSTRGPDIVNASMTEQAPLVLVSNRGPVTYQEDGSVKRGTGGLVTALTGLASHRDAIWIASAMTQEDVDVAREHGGKPFEVEAPEGGSFRIRFVESEDEAYDRFYNIIANPMLWFIQHYLWDLSNAPDIRRHEVDRLRRGLPAGQSRPRRGRGGRDRGPGRARRHGPRLPPLHAARDGPRSAAGRLPAPLRPHPLDPAGRLAGAADEDPRRRSTTGCWPTTSSASTPAPTSATSCSAAAT